ncbi:MAG: RiPP maturation radical SAM protein 1 [Desulfobacula sp.]|nr:RiPP maturation radical SAM protein 1 [Desulfobacula sp.]
MIYLVNMPFAFLTYPNLALSTMKSQLHFAGLDAKVLNLNISFAKRLGFRQYSNISFMKAIDPRMSEWFFSEQAWGESFPPYEEDFLKLCIENLRSTEKIRENQSLILRIRKEIVPKWLRESLECLDLSGRSSVVAFSCSFFQTIPSLALARLIKKSYPKVKIVFGGACFHGEMGEEIFSKTAWIDAVSTGEADDIAVELFHALSNDQEPEGIQGVLWRDKSGLIHKNKKELPVSRKILEELPVPDFDDFFADADKNGLTREPEWEKRAFLPFESARGCWKAKKEHCRFCGATSNNLSFRVKSADKTLQTLKEYLTRYPLRRFHATDPNFSPGFFRTLLPRLKPELGKQGISLFYEVTSGLDRKKVKALADAGIIVVQAGIESMNTRLLKLMNKSVSALQNVFFLKCCAEYGVVPLWNFLIRVPGEQRKDYKTMEKLIPLISHLRPPIYEPSPIQCHRFSPYFEKAGTWAENIRPQFWYKGLFPSNRINLSRVAYYFDADWKDVLPEKDYEKITEKVREWIIQWRPDRTLPQLIVSSEKDRGLKIYDTRGEKEKTWHLDPLQAQFYRAIANPKAISDISDISDIADQKNLSAIADEFISNGLAIEEKGVYLALGLITGGKK